MQSLRAALSVQVSLAGGFLRWLPEKTLNFVFFPCRFADRVLVTVYAFCSLLVIDD
jgi:hypothetical protein